MNKIQTFELIEEMKKSHGSQMHKIELLLDGKDVDVEKDTSDFSGHVRARSMILCAPELSRTIVVLL